MKTWEVDIELRVRKTLCFTGPNTKEAAGLLVTMVLTGEIDMMHFVRWDLDRVAGRAVPAEVIIDNDPQIVAVREMSE